MVVKAKPRAGELSTANYGWVKPTVGASNDAWGGYINADLDSIDSTVNSIQTSVPAASTTTPVMDGAAAVGAAATFAKADHVHPTDTSRLAVVGTATNNNAAAGAIGEVISSNVAPGAVTGLSSGTQVNITSISLTAGDWDVSATGATNPNTTTTLPAGNAFFGISTTSASLPATAQGLAIIAIGSGVPAGTPVCASCGTIRLSLAATTTVYLVVLLSFAVSTCGSYGYLWARRAR